MYVRICTYIRGTRGCSGCIRKYSESRVPLEGVIMGDV